MASLYSLAEHCDYGQLKDELIQDWFVVGLRAAKMSKKLQPDADLTLEKAVNQARQKKRVHGQQSIVRSQIINDNRLNFVKQKPKQQRTVKTH